MMMHSSRKTLLALLFISMAAGLFAFPGIQSLFPTSSGQYVYYRDYSFPKETYIGFLQYDEGTYAIRYFTQVPENGTLPIIEMYLTLDTDVDYVDITGEKIVSPVTQNDVELMNYLHDLLYEFASRRKKINDADFLNTVTSSEDFMQFGGMVTIDWDFYIPIFNLNRMISEEGDILFEAVTMGTLKDNNDQSFVSFSGIENIPIIDDYYISLLSPAEDYADIITINDGLYAIGSSGVLTTSYSRLTDEPLTTEEQNALKDMLVEQAWQIIYSSANSYFALIENMYLPCTDITLSPTSFYLRALCSEDGNDYSDPHYIIIGYAMNGLGFETKTLLIPMDDYWARPEFYDSLVQ